jgi:flagellar hook-associated protein 3 FlgL
MAITRVTQRMMTQQSLDSVDNGLVRMSKAQEQLSTGKRINRPSDDPTGTSTAMKARAGVADNQQYQRNASDGIGWLTTIDTTLQTANNSVQRAYTLALQGANTADLSQTSANALADEIDQIRSGLIDSANATYLGRPVFGGTTSGDVAYDDSGAYVGDTGSVTRRVGPETVVRVDSSGPSVFGPDSSGASVFDDLAALSSSLRSMSTSGIQAGVASMQTDLGRISAAEASEGARYNQISTASDNASAQVLALQKTQTDVEDIDVAQATINLETQQTAYQAALAATSKSVQRSLLDYLQ